LSTQFISISQKDSWTAAMAQMLKHSAYFELISRLMTSANSLNVRALNLFLYLKKDSWTSAMAQMLKHSIYIYLTKRLMDSSNGSNVRTLDLF
jgi:hypothetical protein